MTSFSDGFGRPDSTDLGANWVEVSGDWSIVSGQLSPGAAGGTIILRAAGAMASNDNYAQVTITATTVASQGVWCRGNTTISQGYLWRNNGTSWDLFQVIGGSFTSIGTYAAAAAPGDVAKVQAVGSTIQGYVNGIQRVSVTNTNVPTGTSVGIRSDSAGALRYDDFAAADVTEGATLGIAGSIETAQPLTGTMAASLAVAAAVEAARPLTGLVTAALGTAGTTETALPLTGGKSAALGLAAESNTAQPLVGTKTTPLPVATSVETAQPLTGAKAASLGTAAVVETAQPLVGTKSATLGTAVEISTARPLAGSGPSLTANVTFTIAPTADRWTAREPTGARWSAGVGTARWSARDPNG